MTCLSSTIKDALCTNNLQLAITTAPLSVTLSDITQNYHRTDHCSHICPLRKGEILVFSTCARGGGQRGRAAAARCW